MANFLFNLYKEETLKGNVDLSTAVIKAALIDENYWTPAATADYLADISASAIRATSGAFANKSEVDGIFDADDITFSLVEAGDPIQGILLYVDTGSAATSLLVGYIDTATGLPITPNGGNLLVSWATTGYKIFGI